MAQLAMDLSIRFVGPRLRDEPEINRAIRRDARLAGRRALSRIRPKVRAAAPKRTNKLARSFQVRNARAPVPGAITSRLSTRRVFYATFTNYDNPGSVGWFDNSSRAALDDELAGQLGAAVNGIAARYAAAAGRQAIADLQRRLERRFARNFRAASRGVIASLINQRGVPRQQVTFTESDIGE